MKLTTRRRNIISGLCAMVLVSGLTTIGVKWSFGAFDDGYELQADFAAAGQGLVEGSDVKMRGINIGHVESIELVEGRARVTMFISEGNDIPAETSSFTVRAKTLFGEKFVGVEPGSDEASGPYFDDGDAVPRFFEPGIDLPPGTTVSSDGTALRTAGGFELEQVLSEAYPILRAIEPEELFTIVHTLAEAGDGLGPTINRSLVNGAAVLDVSASRTAETAQFLEDLAALSDELAGRAPDLIEGAEDLNVALPALTEDPDALGAFLREAALLSEDISDLLDANTGFIDSVYSDGQAVLDTLYAGRAQLVPLVIGIRQYAETAAGAARIPVPNGTLMAAVKGLLGGDLCGVVPCTGALAAGTSAPPATPGAPGQSVGDILDDLGLDDINGQVSSGTEAIVDLLTGLVGGPR